MSLLKVNKRSVLTLPVERKKLIAALEQPHLTIANQTQGILVT